MKTYEIKIKHYSSDVYTIIVASPTFRDAFKRVPALAIKKLGYRTVYRILSITETAVLDG